MRYRLSGLLLAVVSIGASAATVTQMGTNVTFSYDDATLYGAGTVVGDSIFFSPTGFKAESLNDDGVVTANETLNITVEVKSGSSYVIEQFLLVEQGDYFLNGSSSSVDASGQLQVSSLATLCGFFVCNDTEIFSAGPLTTTGALTAWSASTQIDFDDTAGWGSDTGVIAQIQNDLTAISTINGESALVQKKGQGVGLIVNEMSGTMIPVPAPLWLLGSALGLLGWLRRR